ncbi:MAG TPA: hypothetical protein VL588_01680 [Bdellovibrionota bacterium]|jgi:hypothetical protein|nr:hypothetical protein [Bdellovibrionota bacterium]
MAPIRTTRLIVIATAMCLGLAASAPARAGVWLEASAAFLQLQDDSGSTNLTASHWLGQGTVGYRFPQGFLLAGQGISSRSTSDANRGVTAWGPKGGFFLKGIELTAGYLAQATEDVDGVHRTGGGFSVNLGYHYDLAKWLSVGLNCTYIQLRFTDQDGVPLTVKPGFTAFAPALSLGIQI